MGTIKDFLFLIKKYPPGVCCIANCVCVCARTDFVLKRARIILAEIASPFLVYIYILYSCIIFYGGIFIHKCIYVKFTASHSMVWNQMRYVVYCKHSVSYDYHSPQPLPHILPNTKNPNYDITKISFHIL